MQEKRVGDLKRADKWQSGNQCVINRAKLSVSSLIFSLFCENKLRRRKDRKCITMKYRDVFTTFNEKIFNIRKMGMLVVQT